MALNKKTIKLKKELKLFDVFAIAIGATISGGFFLLPGLAAEKMGSGIFLAYLLAAIPLIPAMLSKIELATALPRSGGVYFFLDRSLGPLFGTIGGIGIWLTLSLKVSFALIGMGAYLSIFFPQFPLVYLAVTFAILLCILNLAGAKKSGFIQILLVIGLLIILTVFIIGGLPEVNLSHFSKIKNIGFDDLFATTGLVYISYIGVTKVASISEEIKDPEKNIPKGVFLAMGLAIIIYVLGTFIMAGILPIEKLSGSLTPASDAAGVIFGRYGVIILAVAALLSFISVANVGILSSSRYPLAMSRDHIFPRYFNKINTKGTPVLSIVITTLLIIIFIVFLDPLKIAKLASAFQLMMFAFVCLAVIVMRESKITSYDPGYKTPFYPWIQIFGIAANFWLITKMGFLPIVFSLGLIILSVAWYFYYAKNKVIRNGAIYHIFERLGRHRYTALDSEFRQILKEKGLRETDPFEDIVSRSYVIDLVEKQNFESVVKTVSGIVAQYVDKTAAEIENMFLEGTRMGATPVTHGIALPHLRLRGIQEAMMVIVRGRKGLHIVFKDPLTDKEETEEDIFALFFLISPEKDPTQHLRILAKIAGRVEEENFIEEWQAAGNEQELKECLFHEERSLSVIVGENQNSKELIGKTLKEIVLPEGCLIALVRRGGSTTVPNASTKLLDGDVLTVIGNKDGITKLKEKFGQERLS